MEDQATQQLDQTILIMRSNIKTSYEMEVVGKALSAYPNIARWSVDLDDWEHVLKVVTKTPTQYLFIQSIVEHLGYSCSELKS